MKKSLILIILAVLTISCSSDSSSNQTFSGVLIQKTIQQFTNGSPSITTFYHYNGAKLTSVTSDDFLYKYFYSGNLIIKEEIYHTNDLAYVLDFDYDPQNRLIQYKREAVGPGQIFRNVYHYNTDNTISVDEYFIYETGSEEELTQAKYYMSSAGEIEKMENYNGTVTETATFTYDSKNNPFKNVLGMDKLLIPGGFYSNVIHQVYTGYPPEVSDVTSEFTYNSDNYPIAMSRTIGTNQDSTMQYFYQ